MRNASKVGFVLVIFGVMLFGTYAFLERSFFAPKKDTYYAKFKDAGGVTTGAKVLLAGVAVGQVSKVELDGIQARISLELKQGTSIPSGTVANLPTALIGIGDRQIELIPPEKLSGKTLTVGSTLEGVQKSALEAFAPDSKETIKALQSTLQAATKTLDATTKLVSDQRLKGELSQLLASTSKTSDSIGQMVGRLDQTIAQNQHALSAMLKNGQEVSSDLAHMSRSFAEYVQSGKLNTNVDALFAKMTTTIDTATALVNDFRTIAQDPTMRNNLTEITANVREMTKTGTKIAVNAEAMTAKGTEFAEQATLLMSKANKFADDAGELLKELKKKLLGGAAGGVSSSLKNMEASLDVLRESRPNRWRTDINARIPTGTNKSIHVGMFDAFEANKVNLQLGATRGNSELRYGVHASKPGIGVDYTISPKLQLRGDIFGLNQTRFDLKARYQVTKDFFGWIGVERIFKRNAPMIGIGIRK